MSERIPRCEGCPLAGRPLCSLDRVPEGEALIAFVGSSPRSYETRSNLAFSGEGPKLLRQLLTHFDIPIDRCLFTHATRCQMPRGRKAKMAEVRACHPTLAQALRAARPRVIVAMGDDAVNSLLGSGRAASTRRGHVGLWEDVPVYPTVSSHQLVRMNRRFAGADEKWESAGSPDMFPDLALDVERIADFVLRGTPLVESIPYERYWLVRTENRFEALLKRLDALPAGTEISADVETSSRDHRSGKILSLGLCWKEGTGVGIDWRLMTPDKVSRLSSRLLRHRLVFWNAPFDVPWMETFGLRHNFVGDAMLMHYLVDERKGTHRLERQAIDRLHWPPYETQLKEKYGVGSEAEDEESASYENVADEDLLRYNIADCDATLRLWHRLGKEAEEDQVAHLHDELLIPASRHFMRLEREGMLVDYPYLQELGEKWQKEISDLEEELRSYPGAEELNFRSSKQIASYIYDTLGLTQMPAEDGEFVDPDLVLELTDMVDDEDAQEYFRTASSATFMKLKPRSTATYMLWWLGEQHPWPKAMVRRRIVGTRYQNYYDGIRKRLSEGKIRPQFKLHGTRTGRISSSNPNIHGIARKNEIKNIFVADQGHTLIAADYSQAEVRMMAHFARDQDLARALQESDIHRAIARRLFSVTEEDLQGMDEERVKFLRRAAKTIIFGLIYGRTAKSLAPQLGVSIEETEVYIQDLFRMMPGVPKYIAEQQARVLKTQEAVSLFGRKRRFPLILKGNRSEVKRKGVNMPIQSSVSDMTLMAHMKIVQRLDQLEMSPRVWPHIHDGFLLQVPDRYVEPAIEVTREVMLAPPFETDVHFAAEIEVGKRWGDMEKVFAG